MIFKKITLSTLFFISSAFLTQAATCTTLTKDLFKNSKGTDVKNLQQFLFDTGYLASVPNGNYGAGTVSAVKKFQAKNGLAQTGAIGKMNREKIKVLSCKTINTATKESRVDTSTTTPTGESTSANTSTTSIILIDKKYSTVSNLVTIAGKLAYSARINNENYVVYDGKEYRTGTGGYLFPPLNVGDKLAYEVMLRNDEGTMSNFIGYDGKELGKEYSYIMNPVSINGKLAYHAVRGKNSLGWDKAFIVYDGKEFGNEYEHVYDAFNVGEKLAYEVGVGKE